MKIGLLTQPLGRNYGGILQAYALQTFLRQMGHEPLVVDICRKPVKHVWLQFFARMVKRGVLRYILKIPGSPSPVERIMTVSDANVIYKNLKDFVSSNITMTKNIAPIKDIPYLKKLGFDCFIVGSDQVWRPRFSPHLPHYFLDFLDKDKEVLRIAYAASFGLENGSEFSDELMLLEASQYNVLANHDNAPNQGNLFVYILDESGDKEKLVRKIAECRGLQPFKILPEAKFNEVEAKDIEKCVFKSVEQWLCGLLGAKYVVTDSFHGCVFSIIFQKPFIAIGNKARGIARFKSLLKMFRLDERLVYSSSDLSEKLIFGDIDFNYVQQILCKERVKAKNFLVTALKRVKI
jgi:hypothetical protein